jgi:hypothetical protein
MTTVRTLESTLFPVIIGFDSHFRLLLVRDSSPGQPWTAAEDIFHTADAFADPRTALAEHHHGIPPREQVLGNRRVLAHDSSTSTSSDTNG